MIGAAARLLHFVWTQPLNRHARGAALMRVLRWQFASRRQPGPHVLPFVGETRLYAVRGEAAVTGNWYCGLHEAATMGFVLHVLRPGDLFLDVGANSGSYTVLAAGAAGADVVAVEPLPASFARLQANVQLNDLARRTRLHAIGLSDTAGVLRFTSGLDSMNHVLTASEGEAGIQVPVCRLDELVADAIPTIVKVDVEGHEAAVLRGAVRTLDDRRLKAVIVETNGTGLRYGENDEVQRALLVAAGFGECSYDPLTRGLQPGSQSGDNSLFVRELEWARQRIAAAPRFRLVNGML